MSRQRTDVLERMSQYIEETDSGCTRWHGAKDQDGYAMFWYDGRTRHASRALWETCHGPIPEGLIILHTCDNTECLELTHLRLGTPKDNSQDALQKGRLDPHRKVDTEIIQTINMMRKTGYSRREIMRALNIGSTTFYRYIAVENKRPDKRRR